MRTAAPLTPPVNPIVPCYDAAVFGWFLRRTRTSVTHISAMAYASLFPRDIQEAVQDRFPEVDLCAASTSALEGLDAAGVAYNDILVIHAGTIVGQLNRGWPSNDNRWSYDRAHEERRDRLRLREILRFVEIAQALDSPGDPDGDDSEDPFSVLDLNVDAGLDEATARWKERLLEYHPDKVARLGPKIQQVAEAETKRLNAAYQEIRSAMRNRRHRRSA